MIEAVGLPETADAALRAVRKGGLVNLFAGCPADTRLALDAQRLHYQELTIKSTFHHTPESIRKAFRLIADGTVDPRDFITGEAPLEGLPAELRRLAARRRRAEDRDPDLGQRVGREAKRAPWGALSCGTVPAVSSGASPSSRPSSCATFFAAFFAFFATFFAAFFAFFATFFDGLLRLLRRGLLRDFSSARPSSSSS